MRERERERKEMIKKNLSGVCSSHANLHGVFILAVTLKPQRQAHLIVLCRAPSRGEKMMG